MDRISGVNPGTGIRASWGNGVVDELRRQYIIPGNGIKVTRTTKGTVIEIDSPPEQQAGGTSGEVVSDVIPCLVYGGTGLTGYDATLYANGLGEKSTGTGTLYCPEVSTHAYLPDGTSVLAHVCPATYTASDEEGDEIAEGGGE